MNKTETLEYIQNMRTKARQSHDIESAQYYLTAAILQALTHIIEEEK